MSYCARPRAHGETAQKCATQHRHEVPNIHRHDRQHPVRRLVECAWQHQ